MNINRITAFGAALVLTGSVAAADPFGQQLVQDRPDRG